MKKFWLLESIKTGLIIEVSNNFKVKGKEIFVKLANGKTAKITTKNIA